MQLVIEPNGEVRCIYAEVLNLTTLGAPSIRRASHVEPDQHGRWLADMQPVGGPKLGPFSYRSEALQAERDWLELNWLANVAANRNL